MVTLPPLRANVQAIAWQQSASDSMVATLASANGVLLKAGTGLGKMYMACNAIRDMISNGTLKRQPNSINPFLVLWLTPKSVKPQTMQVVHAYGLTAHVMVMSYSEIKSSMGRMYITWIKDSAGGDDLPIWNMNMLPALVKCDECQVLKNPNSLQSRVIRALPSTVKSIFASATPFQRVVDATTLCERFNARVSYAPTLGIDASNSSKILDFIASPKSKDEYSPSAVKRLRQELDKYIVEVKGVRFKYPARTNCISIRFKDSAEAAAYQLLVDQLIENLKKRKGKDDEFSAIHFLVEMQKMQQGAELLRTEHIVERVHANLDKHAVIIASNFVDTLRDVYRKLIRDNIPAERIAFIVGGQKLEERQQMVSDFQRGKRDILLFTMRSGGVGISLHHDRPETKPRHIILPPTWSAIDLVQALGRAHRLTSLSPTTQEILWYADTIETAVKIKVELKVKCLNEAVTAKEQFIDVFAKGLDTEIAADSISDAIESTSRHSDQDSDDVSSTDDDDAITGEGLENTNE